MESASFLIVGSGWRAEFYLRAAKALAPGLTCAGLVSRREDRRFELEALYGVTTWGDLSSALRTGPRFVVVSVARDVVGQVLERLCQAAVPVLVETPVGLSCAELRLAWSLANQGAIIQVAEQYRFQPLHAARLALAKSGIIGQVTSATLSATHGYHAASLLFEYLDIGADDWLEVEVTARSLTSKVLAGPGREGPPQQAELVSEERVIAVVSDGNKHGIYDFTGQQYFSEIRSRHVALRGDAGEITDEVARFVERSGAGWRAREDHLRPMRAGLDGDLRGLDLEEIRFGDRTLYQNPYVGSRLSDEEIAVAQCLAAMNAFLDGGDELYPVARACRDRYLELAIDAACQQGPLRIKIDEWQLETTLGPNNKSD